MALLATKTDEKTDDNEIVSFVENEFKRRQEERRPFECTWRLNLAFLEGNQYVDVNTATMSLEETPMMYWWESREVFNHLSPTTETRIAKLSRMRPILKTRPGTNEQADLRASKVGTMLLKNIYNDHLVQTKLYELYAWLESCGTVIFKNTWDSQKGPTVARMVNEQGEEENVQEGDLSVSLVPPQEIYPDSSYRQDIRDCKSIIHAKAYHIDEVMETWGVKVQSEDTTVLTFQKSMVGVGGLGYGMGGFHMVTAKLKDHVLVKEYWERPSKKYPEGRLIIIAGGKLLYEGALPYPVGEYNSPDLPFTKVDCIKRPGVFWGRTVVERLIPLQRRYNALRNRKAEYLNRCSIGMWSIEEGAVDLDDMEANVGSPGFICVYKRGYNKPILEGNPQLPNAFETEESSILHEFNLISGVSELSMHSQAPPGVKSGVALSIAQEQDDTRIQLTSSNIETFLVENGKQWLRMYKKFAVGQRVLKIIGKNNVVDLLDWTGADIRSDDVIVESWSALADSPAQRRQMVFDLLNTKLLYDEQGRLNKEMKAKVFEMLELGNWDNGDEIETLHIDKAERENRSMEQAAFMPPHSYDDHILHVAKHNAFRLTVEYEQLITQNPMIDQIFQQHTDIHLQYLIQQAQALQGPALQPPAS